MADPYLLASTSSERLSEGEEYEAQRSWVSDANKCTFIVFDREAHEASCPRGEDGSLLYGQGCTAGMVGDVNLFLQDAALVAEDYFGGAACPGGAAEVMVMIAEPEYRRRGCARRAVEALMWYGAASLNLLRFVAKISEDNAPSLALFTEKLGFRVARRVPAFQEVHLVRELGEDCGEGAAFCTLVSCHPAAEDVLEGEQEAV